MKDPMKWRRELSVQVSQMDTPALEKRYKELQERVLPNIPETVSIWDSLDTPLQGTEEERAEFHFVQDEIETRKSRVRDAAWDAYLRHEDTQDLPHKGGQSG